MLKLLFFWRVNKVFILFLLLFFVGIQAFSQQIELKGKIVEANTGLAIPSAIVRLDRDATTTVSNANGDFSMKVKLFPLSLDISILGYKKQHVVVNDSNPIEIRLIEDPNYLKQVVVVGYGTQRRKELTGSVASVSKSHLNYNVAPSVDVLLGGAVAGVNVTQNSGQPGAPASIRIRGGNSINASNDPLYVIDGFPYFSDNSSTKVGMSGVEGESNPLNLLNPSDIASIDVLKDVSATAIYGSRGSNGVILITTKKGLIGKNTINYQNSFGVSKSVKKLKLMNASQWARMQKDYFLNKPGYSDSEINELGEGYQWQDAVLQTGHSQNHAISINGGDQQSHYFISGNYLSQDGVILKSGFERIGGKMNYDKEVTDQLTIGLNLTGNKSTQNSLTTFEGVSYNSSPFSKGIANSLTYALYIPPVVPIYNSDNSYNYNNPFEYAYLREGSKTANPVSDLKHSLAQTINTSFLGNFFAQYAFSNDLKAKLNLGSNVSHTTQNYFSPNYTAIGLEPDGLGGIGNKRVEIFLSELTLNYSKKINEHHALEALAGLTYQSTETTFITTMSAGFTNQTRGVFNLQDGLPYGDTPIFSGESRSGLYSILGRLNYSLLDRYHFTGTFRTDYSTRFAHRWGLFPSVGFSWNILDEDFLNDASIVDNLKLRLSSGSVGNQEVGDYEYLQTLEATRYGGTVAYRVGNSGNDNLKWETTTQSNLGIDAGFFKHRISATADVYYKKTSDLLLLIPPTLGEENKQLVNVGNVVNKGLEFSVNAEILRIRDLSWSITANIARNLNVITALKGDGDIVDGVDILRVGESLGSFYGLVFDGVVQQNEDASKLPSTPAYTVPKPGDPKFRDIRKDDHIDKFDRVVLGSKQPDFTYGFSSTLHYKQLDLFVLLQGSHGNKVYNKLRRYLESPNDAYNASAVLLNSWTETNPSNTIPRITDVPLSSELDSRYIEDASFARLKTVTLGYTFGNSFHAALKTPLKLRLFATVLNLFTLSRYKGYDPEIASGVDLGAYPMPRSVQAGINITF
ncbi:MAG TPA: TonB-dependent receptor [Bacteroidales bacterium]|nr:TonB-dependent receptor [Bacteroidales bacterium]